jgi:hypothetical protein
LGRRLGKLVAGLQVCSTGTPGMCGHNHQCPDRGEASSGNASPLASCGKLRVSCGWRVVLVDTSCCCLVHSHPRICLNHWSPQVLQFLSGLHIPFPAVVIGLLNRLHLHTTDYISHSLALTYMVLPNDERISKGLEPFPRAQRSELPTHRRVLALVCGPRTYGNLNALRL